MNSRDNIEQIPEQKRTNKQEWTPKQLEIAEKFREIIPKARQHKINFSTALLGKHIKTCGSLIDNQTFANLKLLNAYLRKHYTLEIVKADDGARGARVLRHSETKVPLARSDEGAQARGRKRRKKLPENYNRWKANTLPNDFLRSTTHNDVGQPKKRKKQDEEYPRPEIQTDETQADSFLQVDTSGAMPDNTSVPPGPLMNTVTPPTQPVTTVPQQENVVPQSSSQNNILKHYPVRLFDHNTFSQNQYHYNEDYDFSSLSKVCDTWIEWSNEKNKPR